VDIRFALICISCYDAVGDLPSSIAGCAEGFSSETCSANLTITLLTNPPPEGALRPLSQPT
jgi:hypothetical protein